MAFVVLLLYIFIEGTFVSAASSPLNSTSLFDDDELLTI